MAPLPDILQLNTASQEIEMMIRAVKNMNLSKAFLEVSPFFKEYDYIFFSFTPIFDTKIKQNFKVKRE